MAWIFTKKGQFSVPTGAIGEEELFDLALDLGAEDIVLDGEAYEVEAPPETYLGVLKGLRDRDIELLDHSLAMIPGNTVKVDADQAPQLLRLMEMIEDQDDVQNVWANLEIDESVLAEIG